MVVIRNMALDEEVQVLSADYYDTKGMLIKNDYSQPVNLAPLGTSTSVFQSRARRGGGANFIIRRHAEEAVNVPISNP